MDEKTIVVKKLSRIYKVHLKKEGVKASLKALLHREYKYIDAVKNINFTINQGELVGFIGPNGAGKTTTLKMLGGLLYPSDGSIEVLGFTPFDRKEEYLKKISLVLGQKNQLWWDLPVIETLNLQKELYEIPDEDYKQSLNELCTMLEIKDVLHQQVRQLSLGQRMKCELAAALIYKPKVLFLDEPTIGLDIFMQKKVREFIKQYNERYKATVILTSHYMDDVKAICQRIIMIDHGMIIFDGKLQDLIMLNANYKILVPIFNSPVNIKELKTIGKIIEFDYPKAIITVPREEVSQRAAELLKKFDIDDLDINEPELEDVINTFYEIKKHEHT